MIMNDLQKCFAMLIDAVIYYLKRSTFGNGVVEKFSSIPQFFFEIIICVDSFECLGMMIYWDKTTPTMNEYRN